MTEQRRIQCVPQRWHVDTEEIGCKSAVKCSRVYLPNLGSTRAYSQTWNYQPTSLALFLTIPETCSSASQHRCLPHRSFWSELSLPVLEFDEVTSKNWQICWQIFASQKLIFKSPSFVQNFPAVFFLVTKAIVCLSVRAKKVIMENFPQLTSEENKREGEEGWD